MSYLVSYSCIAFAASQLGNAFILVKVALQDVLFAGLPPRRHYRADHWRCCLLGWAMVLDLACCQSWDLAAQIQVWLYVASQLLDFVESRCLRTGIRIVIRLGVMLFVGPCSLLLTATIIVHLFSLLPFIRILGILNSQLEVFDIHWTSILCGIRQQPIAHAICWSPLILQRWSIEHIGFNLNIGLPIHTIEWILLMRL